MEYLIVTGRKQLKMLEGMASFWILWSLYFVFVVFYYGIENLIIQGRRKLRVFRLNGYLKYSYYNG